MDSAITSCAGAEEAYAARRCKHGCLLMRKRVAGYPLIGLCGHKNASKTTLVCRLVEHFAELGHRVATVKYAHCDVEIDHEGRDSFRHRQAGARSVALVSPYRWATIHEVDEIAPVPPLERVVAALGPADLVLVESNKHGDHPKIEVRDVASARPLLADADERIVAIAANGPLTHPRLPVFHRDDVAAIADFIRNLLELPEP